MTCTLSKNSIAEYMDMKNTIRVEPKNGYRAVLEKVSKNRIVFILIVILCELIMQLRHDLTVMRNTKYAVLKSDQIRTNALGNGGPNQVAFGRDVEITLLFGLMRKFS